MKKNSIRRWIVLSFVVILILSVAMSASVNYYEAYADAMRDTGAQAELFSALVTQLMQHEWNLDEPGLSPESDSYIRSRMAFRSLCQEFRMDYASVYTVDPEAPSRFFYFFVASDDEEDRRLLKESTLKAVPTAALQAAEQAILNGSRKPQHAEVRGRFEGEIVWYAPCLNEAGEIQALVAMDYAEAGLRHEIRHNFLVDIIPFSLSLLTGMLILLLLVQRRITGPVSALYERMRRFAMDSREKPEHLELRNRDEIREMADSFEKMTEDISTYVNNIERLTRERTETKIQLELARRIQNGIVPEKTDLSGELFSLRAMTRPARSVGGDFYDCYLRDGDSVCIVMGDVSGKGVSAAITMAMIKTVIREKLMAGLSPAEALNRTNDQFCAQNPENLFATAFAAVLNTRTGELCYANAGHNPPVLLKEQAEYLVPESGIAIGMFEDSDLQDFTLTLLPYQGILLYTDGVTEAVSPERTFFGEERLLEALRDFSPRKDSAEEAVMRVSRAVGSFCDGCEPSDDMAVLALLYTGEGHWKSLPVSHDAFDEVRKTVFDRAGNTPQTRRALLACDEALANIVNYSGAGDLAFICEKKDGALCVMFSDDGIPFDPTAVSPEEKEFEALDSGGMGLKLIAQSVSSMRYERTSGRNVFTLFFPLGEENDTNALLS